MTELETNDELVQKEIKEIFGIKKSDEGYSDEEQKLIDTYGITNLAQTVIDGAKEEFSELPPVEKMALLLAGIGAEIQNPKPNCRRCHGTGMIGVDHKSQIGIPCKCIFKDKEAFTSSQPIVSNRAQRRKAAKVQKRLQKFKG